VPGPVGALERPEPLVGPLGLGDAAADGQGHERLDVVPRIGVAAGVPRHHPEGSCHSAMASTVAEQLVGGDDAVDVSSHTVVRSAAAFDIGGGAWLA
jgi:hypothetical protein